MLTLGIIGSADDARINGTLNGKAFNVKFSDTLLTDLTSKQDELASVGTMEDFETWTESVQVILDGIGEGDIIVTACKDLMHDSKTGKYYLQIDNKISKHPVPQALVDTILESIDKGISADPIIKAWTRFLRNPNFSTTKAENFAAYITARIVDWEEVDRLQEEEGILYDKAVDMATYNDVMISQEGLIVAKKYASLITKGWVIDPETNKPVLEDLYKTTKTVDKFSGEVTESTNYPDYAEELDFEPPIQGRSGNSFEVVDLSGNIVMDDHVIKVGHIHRLKSWNQVNCDDTVSCRPGLHVGGYQYVNTYGGHNNQLLECLVDPSDIGAICDIHRNTDGAIRVKEYFINGAVEGRTKGLYHSSKYASMKDAEWVEMKKAAIEEANRVTAEAIDSIAE